MCASWLGLYHYLARSPRLHADDGDRRYFHGERIRALAGIAAYGLAVGIAWLLTQTVSLVVLFAIPVFYGVTSEGWGSHETSRETTRQPQLSELTEER